MSKKLFSTLLLVSLFALTTKAQDTLYLIFDEAVRLSDNINSKAEEAKPIITRDGSVMYFVRAFHEGNFGFDTKPQNEDIWESVKDADGNWQPALHEKTINDIKNNSVIGNGIDDHVFLLNTYQDKKHLQYGVALTKKHGEHNWSHPTVIPIPKLKYQGTFYDFYITHDEKAMIISIKGDDTKGEEDLYVAFNNNGNWTEPKNLDSIINTSGFEMSPFLTEDKQFLFFSTNGRKDGFGDADVYYSKRLDDTWTNWTEPKNLGKIVNTEFMDCYFTMSDSGDFYFSSNRIKENGLDIYQAKLKPIIYYVDASLVVEVRDKKDSSLLSDVSILLTQDSSESKVFMTDAQGIINHNIGTVVKGTEVNFSFKFEKKDHITEVLSKSYVLDSSQQIKIVEYMDKIKIGMDVAKVVDIHNIYFDVDKFDIRPDAAIELDKIVKVMNENPTMVIELGAHTDCRGQAKYNLTLSDNRAKASAQYIKERITSPERIKGIGYGESKLVNDCGCEGKKVSPCSEEQHQENRRTEFKIVTMGSTGK